MPAYHFEMEMSRWSKGLLAAIVVIAALPLFPLSAYYFTGDGFLHLFRLYEFDRVLRQDVWYPRGAPDFANGYGYPIFNYYAPFAFYLAETIHLLGANIPHAIIATFVVSIAIAATGAYALGVELAREHPRANAIGLLTALAYVFSPYALLEFYVRGAIAEALAVAWLPWLVWSLTRTLTRASIAATGLAALFAGLLVISHNLTVLLLAPFLLVYVAWEWWRLIRTRSRFCRCSCAR